MNFYTKYRPLKNKDFFRFILKTFFQKYILRNRFISLNKIYFQELTGVTSTALG